MKFFIPHAKDDKDRDSVYNSIKKFVKQQSKWNISDRKIFSINYIHDGKEYYAEVGKLEQRNQQEVVAILESTTYLICTPNRGVLRGQPILVGRNEVVGIVDFE